MQPDIKTRLAQCAAVGTVIGPNTVTLLDDARERIAELEAALREIAALPDVDADQRGVIAREALED